MNNIFQKIGTIFENLKIKPRMFEIMLWKFCNENSSLICFRDVSFFFMM